jgi:hypothetical protein
METARILVVHGEGLGNIVQILPLLSVLDREIGTTDLALPNSSFGISKDLFPGRTVYLPGENIREGDYDGKVVTIWGSIHGRDTAPSLRVLNAIHNQQMRLDCSEVSVYLRAALEVGVKSDKLGYDCKSLLGYENPDNFFDVVISNGYNWKRGDFWKAKSYPRYEDVAVKLREKGLSVCSVGDNREYIKGTVDQTGVGLMKTLGLIKNARVVISNDSGFYHCACAFNVPCVVVFTFTNVTKNYDPVFHKSAVVMRNKLPCQGDCHARRRWTNCTHMDCRELPVESIVSKAMSIVGC